MAYAPSHDVAPDQIHGPFPGKETKGLSRINLPPSEIQDHAQMISFEDCVALCGLSEGEIAAIAEHEHVPEIAAAILGQYLLRQKNGERDIQQMIVDDIRAALLCKDTMHAAGLASALHHFHNTHPDCGVASREC